MVGTQWTRRYAAQRCPGPLQSFEKRAPAFPGEQPAEGGEERAVSRPVPDAAMELALKDTNLVAEDDQFDVLVYVVAPA